MPGGCHYSQSVLEDLLLTLSPLLERQPPSREMCAAFSRHCRLHPRSSLVRGLFTSVVHRILKHNVVSPLLSLSLKNPRPYQSIGLPCIEASVGVHRWASIGGGVAIHPRK